MGRKANPTMIGAFVVGAIALAVAGLLVFGSGQMFKQTRKFVCFFTGAVDGLNVGAPVKFKGVEIGSVVDIRLRIEGQPPVNPQQIEKGIRIPVIIELDQTKLVGLGAASFSRGARFKEVIDAGLRAQLNAQSLVTGLLFVQLDFRPDTPADFVMPPGSKYAEIPTIPTALEQVRSAAEDVMRRLSKLDVEGLVRSVTETVDGINRMVNAPALKATIESLPETVANVNKAIGSVRDLATRLDTQAGPFLASLKTTTDRTNDALAEMSTTLKTVQVFIDPTSPLATQISFALQELTGAARSVRLLADYLERNPSALVRGKDVKNP
jgi:paraquat-inducible protein B